MKFVKGVQYEAQPAKTTVPNGYQWSYLQPDVWYPARSVWEDSNCFEYYRAGNWIYAGQKGCEHLEGGNWKIRRVKCSK